MKKQNLKRQSKKLSVKKSIQLGGRKLNSLKGKKAYYFILTTGCGAIAGLFLVKILKNLQTVSVTEIAILFLSIVCVILCIDVFSDTNKSKQRIDAGSTKEK